VLIPPTFTSNPAKLLLEVFRLAGRTDTGIIIFCVTLAGAKKVVTQEFAPSPSLSAKEYIPAVLAANRNEIATA